MEEFGAPIGEEGARRFRELDRHMVRIGVPLNMVDILNFAGATPFEEVYSRRVPGVVDGVELLFPSLQDLIEIKLEAGRPQDLADVDRLRKSRP